MATADTITATWVGPHEAETPDGQVLVPGETVVTLAAAEAHDSDYWQVAKGSSGPTKAELLELAAEQGVEVSKSATKAEIQVALDGAGTTPDITPPDPAPVTADEGGAE